jgi:phage terminase large subunit
MVERAYAEPGFRGVCIREVQKDLSESAKKLIEDKIQAFGLGAHFDCQRAQIITPGGGLIIFEGMQDHNNESIKSLEGFDVAWVEEAQTLSKGSLTLLRPTIRKDHSEIWFSWNPTRKTDAVDDFFRGKAGAPERSVVVEANWQDNPWFPEILADEREEDLSKRPDQCDHIWDGGYKKVTEGAYFAADIALMKSQGRLGNVAPDPLMTKRAFWDIGGTGAKADACAIWIAQFVGREIRVLDYYEARGQPLATHVSWLRDNGYGKAMCILPHDGANNEKIIDASYESALRDALFEVEVIPNQGPGAAKMRIESARRLFPSIWMNKSTTEGGLDALGQYHERKDEHRDIGLGPMHDWSSHGADAFGLMCVAYEEPQQKRKAAHRERGANDWMM